MSRDVRRVLRDAAPTVHSKPDIAAIERRVRSRRIRRLTGMVAVAGLIAAAVAVTGATWLGQDGDGRPIVVQPAPPPPSPAETASPAPRPAETTPGTDSAGGWVRIDDPGVFGGPGTQAAAGAVAAGEHVVLVGVDAANAADERLGPGVWLSSGTDRWHRLDAGAIDTGGTQYQDADLLMRDVAASDDGTLVAVGLAGFGEDEQPLVWRSDDGGRTWSLVPVEAPDSAAMEAVAWTGSGFVAVGRAAGPAVWTSTDGERWTQRALPAEGQLVDVAWLADRDQIIAAAVIGDSGQLWTGQPDAEPSTWRLADLPSGLEVNSIAVNSSDSYVAGLARPQGTAYDGVLAASSDGMNWEVDPRSDALGGSGDQLVGTVHIDSNGRVVVAGDSDGQGRIWISPDPETPFETADTSLFPAGSRVATVVDGPHGLVAIGVTGDDIAVWREQDSRSATR